MMCYYIFHVSSEYSEQIWLHNLNAAQYMLIPAEVHAFLSVQWVSVRIPSTSHKTGTRNLVAKAMAFYKLFLITLFSFITDYNLG